MAREREKDSAGQRDRGTARENEGKSNRGRDDGEKLRRPYCCPALRRRTPKTIFVHTVARFVTSGFRRPTRRFCPHCILSASALSLVPEIFASDIFGHYWNFRPPIFVSPSRYAGRTVTRNVLINVFFPSFRPRPITQKYDDSPRLGRIR